MSRTYASRLATIAGLALCLTAPSLGQVVVVEPALDDPGTTNNQSEFVGFISPATSTTLNVTVAGLDATDTVTFGATVVTITAGGTVAAVGGTVTITNADVDANQDGTFGDGLTTSGAGAGVANIRLGPVAGLAGNLSLAAGQVGTGAGAAQIVAFGVRISATTPTTPVTVQTVDPTGFNSATTGFTPSAATETPRVDNSITSLTSAVLSTTGGTSTLSIVCSKPVVSVTGAAATTAATANPSQPVITAATPPVATNITADADIQVATASTFGTPFAAGNAVAATITGAQNNVVQFAITAPAAQLAVGNFVRFNGTDARDYLGNVLSGDTDGVQISALQNLAVTSATFVSTVAPGGGNVAGALRIVFNNPLASVTGILPGTINDAIQILDKTTGQNLSDFTGNTGIFAGTSDFILSNPVIETNPPTGITPGTSILVDVNSPGGGDGVSPNGRLSSAANSTNISSTAGILQVRVRGDGAGAITEITDVFGGVFGNAGGVVATTTVNSDTDAGDGIAPTRTGTAFLDTDGDGAQDAVAIIFDEPVADQTAAVGVELTKVGTIPTRPAYLINPVTGALPTAINTVASGTLTQNIIPITGTTRSTIGATIGAQPTNLTTNNAIVYAFDGLGTDWDNDTTTRKSTTPDPNEPVPGTNDPGAVNLFYNGTTAVATNPLSTTATIAAGTIADAAGNRFLNGGTGTATNAAANTDRAAAALVAACFLTGDNQGGGSNNQLLAEADGAVGDQVANNRLALIFSETMAGAVPVENNLSIGATAIPFALGDFLFNDPTNSTVLDFGLAGSVATIGSALRAGATTTLVQGTAGASNGFTDGVGNQSSFTGRTITDCVAPYVAATLDVNQVAQTGARLVDSNSDGFVDAIALKFTQPIDSSTLQAADFSVNFGGIVGTPTLDATDPSIVNLPITGAQISMTNTLTLTYNSQSATAKLIKAQAAPAGNGVALSPTAGPQTIQVRALQTPIADDHEIAQQVFSGKITTDGTTGVPIGTKIFAMIACPVAQTITATHNNTEFVVSRNQTARDLSATSINAWTNFILQLEANVYLISSTTNSQSYSNTKVVAGSGNAQADVSVSRGVIRCTSNITNLGAITFTGTGQAASERITNGRVSIFWDVLRSNSGTLEGGNGLYAGGYNIFGTPILSRGVVTSSDGSYTMHVSAPVAGFNGRARLDSTGRPIIFVIELTDGRRFAASSLLTSVNGGPVLFRTQVNNNQAGGAAVQGTAFNVNLANIAGGNPLDATNQTIFAGWNTISYARVGGWASATNALPRLPNGVTASNVVIGSSLPSVNAFDQFVYFYDADGSGTGNSGDRMWTAGDDFSSAFDSIALDPDGFPHFAFTMTDRGVQLGSAANQLVGGYAFGFFDGAFGPDATGAGGPNARRPFGLFQFGPRLGNGAIFGTGSSAFPVNGPTKGWALAAAGASASSGSAFLSANPGSDYAISFKNSGPHPTAGGAPTQIDVTSHSSTATNNAQNLGAVADEQALFVHYAQ